MKFFLTLCFLIASTINVLAQRNFKPGYIVTLKGDTTRGFIDHKEWRENPQRINFKTTANDSLQEYTALDLNGFGINLLDQYRSYSGAITKSAVDLADLRTGIDSSVVVDNIFLRLISGGKNVSLYSYRDKIKVRYFISETGAVATELKQYIYLDLKQSDKIREYNYFKQQLLALALKYQSGNNSLEQIIDRTTYKLSNLQDIVYRINGSALTYKVDVEGRGGYRFFAGVAGSFMQASFFRNETSGHFENVFNSKSVQKSLMPALAGGVDIYFNKNVGKMLFRAEANLTFGKVHSTSSSTDDEGFRVTRLDTEFNIKMAAIGFNPQLVYNIYNKQQIKVFLAGGAQFTFWSYSNNRYNTAAYLNNKLETSAERKIAYRTSTTNLTAKAGATLANKVDIYLSYSLPVMVTNYPSYGIDLSFYRLGINYLFQLK